MKYTYVVVRKATAQPTDKRIAWFGQRKTAYVAVSDLTTGRANTDMYSWRYGDIMISTAFDSWWGVAERPVVYPEQLLKYMPPLPEIPI